MTELDNLLELNRKYVENGIVDLLHFEELKSDKDNDSEMPILSKGDVIHRDCWTGKYLVDVINSSYWDGEYWTYTTVGGRQFAYKGLFWSRAGVYGLGLNPCVSNSKKLNLIIQKELGL